MKTFKYLDAPVRFLSLSMNEVVILIIPFFIGTLVDSLFLVPLIGITGVLFVKKLFKRVPKFYGVRFLYWSVPTRQFNRLFRLNLPPSHKRFWVK